VLYVRGEPGFHPQRQAADKRNARRAAFGEAAHQGVDVHGGRAHDAPADLIT
jgi:hypothetical protein